ncbi:unnamed protein product [Closterium sp. Naga37s-1]|nr:unnamed protein product [Closterium sp. Naga37s-1]
MAVRLAPRYAERDEPSGDLDECPICFLYYPSLNTSRCCKKRLCTASRQAHSSGETRRPAGGAEGGGSDDKNAG